MVRLMRFFAVVWLLSWLLAIWLAAAVFGFAGAIATLLFFGGIVASIACCCGFSPGRLIGDTSDWAVSFLYETQKPRVARLLQNRTEPA